MLVCIIDPEQHGDFGEKSLLLQLGKMFSGAEDDAIFTHCKGLTGRVQCADAPLFISNT